MKIVVFGPEKRVGALQGEQVIDLNGAYAKYAAESLNALVPHADASANVPSDLEEFIILDERALEGAQKAIEYVTSKAADQTGLKGERLVMAASETKLHAPIAHRGVKLAMAGANYWDHLLGIRQTENPNVTADEVKAEQRKRGLGGFWKMPSFVVGPEAPVTYPAKTKYLDFEGEITIVIGKTAKDVSADRLMDHVWGVTLQNDWSARDQFDAPLGSLAFATQKNWDGASSIGPCIAVGEIKDVQDVSFKTTVNGQVRQDGNTKGMTFTFAEYLEHLTRDITFSAGDMIAAGTCKGTAMDSTKRVEGGGFVSHDLFLNIGDVVEVSSPQIGTLRNQIVAKSQ